jgi:prepilin-type N-terminal cleavage/methylation domain-containing protein
MLRGTKNGAFTLIEVLVATAILVVVLVLTAQIAGHALTATTASGKQIEAASMARIVLDRFGNDFSSAILNGGATALFFSGSGNGDNAAIGFASKSRARFTDNENVDSDVRGVVLAYKIREQAVPLGSTGTANIPLIARGDATFTYAQTSAGYQADFSLWSIFGVNGRNLPGDLSSANGTNFLSWQGLGDGVLLFHISFILSNGTITQTLQNGSTLNVTYRGFQSNGGTGSCLPIAFTAETTADPNKLYVKGLILGIAVLDGATLRLAYANDSSFSSTLAAQLGRPTQDDETPVGVWQEKLNSVSFLPARQNLRFYQRFYPVSL